MAKKQEYQYRVGQYVKIKPKALKDRVSFSEEQATAIIENGNRLKITEVGTDLRLRLPTDENWYVYKRKCEPYFKAPVIIIQSNVLK